MTCTLVLVFNLATFAQEKQLVIKKTEDFFFNGDGDDESWSRADWVELTLRNNADVSYKTRLKILYSSTGLYFLFDNEDKTITSTLSADNTDLYNEDVVEVFFWTDEDYPFYFEYELSPGNYELPIFVPNVEGDFFGWLPWHYEGERKTRHFTSIQKNNGKIVGWTAEFFIPYALLKPMSNVPPQPGTRWRANMYRIDYDQGPAYWTWRPVRTNFHDYESYGVFLFE